MAKLRIQLGTDGYWGDDPSESFRDGSRDFRKSFAKIEEKLELKEVDSGYDGDGVGYFEYEALSLKDEKQVEEVLGSIKDCDLNSVEKVDDKFVVEMCVVNPNPSDEEGDEEGW
jgi:phosphoribosylaminoimidazole carboxylase (NCAIR synthetase)